MICSCDCGADNAKTYIDKHELNDERLRDMVGLDGLTVGVVVADYRLREGDAQVLYRHLVVLKCGGHATQMRRQVLERLKVARGQSMMQQALDCHQPCLVILDSRHVNKLVVVLRGRQRVRQLVQKALKQGDNGMRIVPVIVRDVDVQNAPIQLRPQRRNHLLLADLPVNALVVYVQFNETRAQLDHGRYVMGHGRALAFVQGNAKVPVVVSC